MTLSIKAYEPWEIDAVLRFGGDPLRLAMIAFAMRLTYSQRLWFAMLVCRLTIRMLEGRA